MIRHCFIHTITLVILVCIRTTRKTVQSVRYSSIISNSNSFLLERHLNSLFTSSSDSIDDLLFSVRRGGSSSLMTRTRFSPRDFNQTSSSRFVEVFEEETEEETEEEYLSEEEEEEEEMLMQEEGEAPQPRPVVYRYFGRSRTRTRPDESIPFILLGSNVDHWRNVGESLASLGFNVIACQRVMDKNATFDPITKCSLSEDGEEGASLIQAVLDALRWPKAVIVGCGNDAISAIQAAIALDSNKQRRKRGYGNGVVAGVILCGDLSQVQRAIRPKQSKGYYPTLSSRSPPTSTMESMTPASVDTFLKESVPCPSMIIWEGAEDTKQQKSSQTMYEENLRTVILGGGSAPHRRLPDQFAWLLSRFVEEKVVAHYPNHTTNSISSTSLSQHIPASSSWTFFQNRDLIVLSPGTLLVAGRIFATTIMYMSAASVLLYQYKRFKFISSSLLHNAAKISVIQKRIWTFVFRIIIEDWNRKVRILNRTKTKFKINYRKKQLNINDGRNNTISTNEGDGINGMDDYHVLYGLDSVMT